MIGYDIEDFFNSTRWRVPLESCLDLICGHGSGRVAAFWFRRF